ncbi:GNAT family N-acetyltransferase [Geofilum rubicundum]|uniref:Lipopolysaccharide biosynthesis protein RffC n=1 Tax=Geofilum rubicundum JCM 15548 TaxID=1236989 RepID=A0A0E9LZR4_9BACT|nr:GNAT family N-acetyltransferase [Geofilum rubicundum]GAO30616.1 lipopolysaccharide biosynthesis protein RffC [Geofilum rubicundum JCM 15548]
MIEKKNWDSNFFGYNVGQYRIEATGKVDVDKIIDESKDFVLTYIFSNKELLIPERLKLADIRITWHRSCDELIEFDDFGDNGFIEEYNDMIHSYNQLLELAFLSGKYSRFLVDENFQNNEFSLLYSEWLGKSVDHTIANIVLVYRIDDQICGFVTLGAKTLTTANIGLISVNVDYQGKGIGSCLLKAAMRFCQKKGFETLEVSTQRNNLPAMKLYERNDFVIKSFEYIYHIWNK